MKPGCRTSRWPSLLALPLALWCAVPGVQWCPLGWAEVSAECFVACVSPAAILGAGTAGCCARSCAVARTEPPGTADAVASCPVEAGAFSCDLEDPGTSGSAPDDRYPGGRAYCLSGPSGGDGLPSAAQQAPRPSGPAAILPGETGVASVPAHARGVVVAVLAHPPPSPAGAVPRGRAPPGSA